MGEVSLDWKRLLNECGLLHFHMKEFRNVTKGIYKHLAMAERLRLLDSLIAELKKHVLFGCLITLRPHDYVTIADQAFRNRYGSAHGMATMLLLLQLHNNLLNPVCRPETIKIFLEGGHKNETDALQQMRDWKELTDPRPEECDGTPVTRTVPYYERTDMLRIAAYGAGTKDQMPPLHAADLLAYIANSRAEVALNGKVDNFTEGVGDRLFAAIPVLSTSYSEKSLREVVGVLREGDRDKARIRAGLHRSQAEFMHSAATNPGSPCNTSPACSTPRASRFPSAR